VEIITKYQGATKMEDSLETVRRDENNKIAYHLYAIEAIAK
jgi:hypothetical protein